MTPERYAQVKQLFLAASDLDPTRRREMLDDACGQDAELRREVESLLAYDHPQTLIRASIDRQTALAGGAPTVPARPWLSSKLRLLRTVTGQLGPRGHAALGGLLACVVIGAVGLVVDATIRSARNDVRAGVLWAVFGLFSVCAVMLVASYASILRLRRLAGAARQLGQYILEQPIGEGGMGRVFKARHVLLKRPVAIKLMKPELVDRTSLARFQREAQLASQLRHPNTIEIYDYGVAADGTFYYAMEFVNGLSLDKLVALHGPLPPARAVYLLKQVCYSLREAHAAGLVHRDLKPQNIMVGCRGGEADVVKVLDFGLVHDIGTPDSQRLTAAGELAGTPLYIAPERLRNPLHSSFALDIYSWAAVAFYVLTGQEVFGGHTVADVLYQVSNAAPALPSDCDRARIPQRLEQLVLAGLAKEPEQRPQSIVKVLDTLNQIHTTDTWGQPEAERWWGQSVQRR